MRNQRFLITHEVRTYQISEEYSARRILLLEDDLTLAEYLAEILRTEGYEVTRVGNGAEGLRATMAAEFDVIVCDMVMPGFPGDMFYLAIQRSNPRLCERFLFTTGHLADPKIDEFIRRVRGLMLWKPFEPHELLSAIKAILERSQGKPSLASTGGTTHRLRDPRLPFSGCVDRKIPASPEVGKPN